MRRPPLPAVALAVVALVVLGPLAAPAPVDASPQPSPICGFCGGTFSDESEDAGVNATVAESHATVQVHENGSATWTVRNRLSAGADRFRANPGLLTDVGMRLATVERGVAEDPRFVDARMDGDTAVLVYRDPDVAERHAGLLVVDYLHHGGYVPWHVVDAESFTIRGPPGTVVANNPGAGVVDGRSVSYAGSSERPVYEGPTLEENPFVVFGPDRSSVTQARASAAVLLAVAPLVVERAGQFLLVPLPLFAVLLGVAVWGVRRFDREVPVRPVAAAVAAIAVLGGAALLVTYDPRSLPGLALVGPALVGLLVGALAYDDRSRGLLATTRGQALVAAGGLVATWAVLAVVHATVFGSDSPARAALRMTAMAFPLAVMLPLGGVLDGERGRRWQWWALAVLAFAAMVPATVNLAAPWSGFGGTVRAMAFVLWALVLPVAGVPLLVLGDRLVDPPSEAPSRQRRLDDV
jgi:hypothetical protein